MREEDSVETVLKNIRLGGEELEKRLDRDKAECGTSRTNENRVPGSLKKNLYQEGEEACGQGRQTKVVNG